jgi:hypothetical protein
MPFTLDLAVNPDDAQLTGKEESAINGERAEERLEAVSSPAIEAEARDPKPGEGAPLAADDDEYEMVELSELIDVPSRPTPLPRHSRELLPPPVRVTKYLQTSSASIPPPPPVPSRSVPPPPLQESSMALPAPPRISSPPDFTISGTVPPLSKPSKTRFVRALSSRYAAAAAVLAALCATGYFAKRGQDTKSEPSRDVAAGNLPAQPQASPPTIATEPAANSAAVLTLQAVETKPTPPPVATEPKKDPPKAKTSEAPKTLALATEVPKAGAPKSALNPAMCTLNLNTIPASHVALDGRDLGMTPKMGISAEPGSHIVIFENAGGKKVTSAQCKAGEQKSVVVRLPI